MLWIWILNKSFFWCNIIFIMGVWEWLMRGFLNLNPPKWFFILLSIKYGGLETEKSHFKKILTSEKCYLKTFLGPWGIPQWKFFAKIGHTKYYPNRMGLLDVARSSQNATHYDKPNFFLLFWKFIMNKENSRNVGLPKWFIDVPPVSNRVKANFQSVTIFRLLILLLTDSLGIIG